MLKKMLHKEPETGKELYEEAEEFLNQRKFKDAIKFYEKALQAGETAAYHGLGIALVNAENPKADVEKGLNYLKQGVELNEPHCIFEIGWFYYSGLVYEKDMSKAAEYWERGAELNDPKSIYNLGSMRMDGVYFEKDPEAAIPFYERAVALNYPEAFVKLGECYQYGTGVAVDFQKALEYFNRVAEFHGGANYDIGVMYELEKYGMKDIPKAIEYFEKAGELGFSQAYTHLGYLYYSGETLPRDAEKALSYYSKAKDDPAAFRSIGVIYKDMGDFEKAAQAFTQATKMDDPASIVELGSMYINGLGVEVDFEKGYNLMKRCGDRHPNALFNLGLMHEKGLYVEQNMAKALEYYGKAAKLGSKDALCNIGCFFARQGDFKRSFELHINNTDHKVSCFQLGLMYQEGLGCEKNVEKRNEYMLKAAELGESDGYLKLGFYYYTGNGCEQDFGKALEYFTKASEMNNAQATYNIGVMYEHGQGVARDPRKKFEYYLKAAQLDHPEGLLNAGFVYYQGELVPKDLKKAYLMFERVIEVGDKTQPYYKQVCKNLAIMNENGEGTPRNPKKAEMYRQMLDEI